jgi:hypothetical protein
MLMMSDKFYIYWFLSKHFDDHKFATINKITIERTNIVFWKKETTYRQRLILNIQNTPTKSD